MRRTAMMLCGLAAAMVLAAGPAGAQTATPPCDSDSLAAETSGKVPELSAFHEVIYSLWHEAWPNKDYRQMRELLPEVRRHVDAINKVKLSGILRDKQAAWQKGVEGLNATLKQYEAAATLEDGTALLAAVEKIHADFEGLVRVIRPPMKELEAYHVELYKIYHHALPNKQWDMLTAAAAAMAKRCEELQAAALPRRLAEKEKEIHQQIALLCWRTKILNEGCDAKNWVDMPAMVENVHDQYVKIADLMGAGSLH